MIRLSLRWATTFCLVSTLLVARPCIAKRESYHARPSILKQMAAPRQPSLRGPNWNAVKRSHLEALAQQLELYPPPTQLYFLARDGETFFDLAQVLLDPNSADFKRLHLINVSRRNMKSPHLRDYLAQEGLSQAALKEGLEAVIIDTGYRGTIPTHIKNLFPQVYRPQIKAHMMLSLNQSIPSSRVFFTPLNPAAAFSDLDKFVGTLEDFEEIPRHNDRSDRFYRHSSGKIHPTSLIPVDRHWGEDGSVNRADALALMKDLVHYSKQPGIKDAFSERRKHWRPLVSALQRLDKEGLKKRLSSLIQSGSVRNTPFPEAIANDFLEYVRTNRPELIAFLPTREEIGLTDSPDDSFQTQILKRYPRFKEIFDAPETKIPELLKKGNFNQVRLFISLFPSPLNFKIVVTHLAALEPKDSATRDQVDQTMVQVLNTTLENTKLHEQSFYNAFSSPQAKHWKDSPEKLVLLAIKHRSDDPEDNLLADYLLPAFTAPHTANWSGALKILKSYIRQYNEELDPFDLYLSFLAAEKMQPQDAKEIIPLLQKQVLSIMEWADNPEVVLETLILAESPQVSQFLSKEVLKNWIDEIFRYANLEVIERLCKDDFDGPYQAYANIVFERHKDRIRNRLQELLDHNEIENPYDIEHIMKKASENQWDSVIHSIKQRRSALLTFVDKSGNSYLQNLLQGQGPTFFWRQELEKQSMKHLLGKDTGQTTHQCLPITKEAELISRQLKAIHPITGTVKAQGEKRKLKDQDLKRTDKEEKTPKTDHAL